MSSHSKIHLLRSEKISQCLLDAGRTPRETHHVKSPQAGIAAAVARPHPSPTPAQRQRPAPAGEFQLEKAIISVGGPKTRRIMWLMWSMCGWCDSTQKNNCRRQVEGRLKRTANVLLSSQHNPVLAVSRHWTWQAMFFFINLEMPTAYAMLGNLGGSHHDFVRTSDSCFWLRTSQDQGNHIFNLPLLPAKGHLSSLDLQKWKHGKPGGLIELLSRSPEKRKKQDGNHEPEC